MVSQIKFIPLRQEHFPRLLTWLNEPHVMKWWPHDHGSGTWTLDDIITKYTSYVDGYKLVDGYKKPIHAFVVYYQNIPVGYAQYYNAYDFPRGYLLEGLSKKLGAVNVFIGEDEYTGKGLGTALINAFLDKQVWPRFDACFVDPEVHNIAAIRAYEKCGFKIVKKDKERSLVWMVKEKTRQIYTCSTSF